MSSYFSLTTLTSPAAIWLFIWMVNNIGVTLLNKAVFAKVHFPYPWLLSAIHMICNSIGCTLIFVALRYSKNSNGSSSSGGGEYTAVATNAAIDDDIDDIDDIDKDNNDDITKNASNNINTTQESSMKEKKINPVDQQSWIVRCLGGDIERKVVNTKGYWMIVAFSVLFSLNIAIGNVSLQYVSVNFNQVMRSLVPAVTIALGLCLGKTFSQHRKLAVVPIIIGVAMACFGDMSYTMIGFIITCFCVFLAALKAVAAGEMLTGDLKLHPVDLLGYMAPLALVQCVLVSFISGEIHDLINDWSTKINPFVVGMYPMIIIWTSGMLSFTLNISSLQANKLTSPLTLCIAANVKQVLMIWLSTIIFNTIITPLNGAGIVVVLLGSALYSYVSITEKPTTTTTTTTASSSSSSSSTEKITDTDDIVRSSSSTTEGIVNRRTTKIMDDIDDTTTIMDDEKMSMMNLSSSSGSVNSSSSSSSSKYKLAIV